MDPIGKLGRVRPPAGPVRFPRPGPAAAPAAGAALIVVIWVVGLLSLFVMAFAFDMHVEARITSSWRKRLQAEYLARAAFELARMTLAETADSDILSPDPSVYLNKGSDEQLRNGAIAIARGSGMTLSRALGAGVLTLRVRPENARINLNSLVVTDNRERTLAAWQPLFETLGVPLQQWDGLVDCLMDWVDMDELTHLNGVESDYYMTRDPPYASKNARIDTVDELALIKGFDEPLGETGEPIYQAVARLVTTYATEPAVNVNAADQATLMSFLGVDAAVAEEILAARRGPDGLEGTEDDLPFKNRGDLQARVPGLPAGAAEKLAFGATGRFSITAVGTVGDISYTTAAIVAFANKQIKILHWIEGDTLPDDLAGTVAAITNAPPDDEK